MTIAAFLSVVLIHLAAAISPGPSFVVSVRTAAAEGFGVGAALALGFGLGALLWASVAMAGLALVFELMPALFTAIKVIGGLFLIFVAVMMWRHAPETVENGQSVGKLKSSLTAIRFGFLTFASNPKPAVFFGAVFVGLVPADTPLIWRAALVCAVFLNETLWYLLVARVFSLPRARTAYLRAKVWVDRFFGGLIGLIGLKIALS